MAQWKQYSGMWASEAQMQAVAAETWPGILLPGGPLYSWGFAAFGQLGQGDRVYRSSPVQVGTQSTWKSIGARYSALAVKSDGTLWSWGINGYGQLGQNDLIYRSSPTQVGALTNWASAFVGNNNHFAIKTDGTLWGMGRNENGSLGVGDQIRRSSPVQIGANTWITINGVDQTTAAIRSDGTLWTFGENTLGCLGANTSLATARRSSPVQVGSDTDWSNVIGTSNGFLARKSTGALFSWGWNDSGALGVGDRIDRSSPTQIGALTTWLTISNSGSYLASVVIKNDNTMWSWGKNDFAALGQNDIVNRSSPTQVGALNTWLKVTSLYLSTLAIKTDGTLWAWGFNQNYGELGLNDRVNRSSPVQVGSDTNWNNAFGGYSASFATKKVITT